MVGPDDNKELFDAELEIEELAMQLADMLGVALYYAGVDKDKIREAVDAYLTGMDDLYQDENIEYGFEEVVKVIEHIKGKRKDLFNR